jgi:hypothetical protein
MRSTILSSAFKHLHRLDMLRTRNLHIVVRAQEYYDELNLRSELAKVTSFLKAHSGIKLLFLTVLCGQSCEASIFAVSCTAL